MSSNKHHNNPKFIDQVEEVNGDAPFESSYSVTWVLVTLTLSSYNSNNNHILSLSSTIITDHYYIVH